MTLDLKARLSHALLFHQAGNLVEAEKLYLEILKDAPEDGNVLNLFGFLNVQTNRFSEAVSYLKKAVERYPNFFEAWFNLGLAYKGMDDFENAIFAYKKALEIEPENVTANFNLANVYECKNETDNAIVYYEYAYKYNKDETDMNIPYFLAICYIKAKNFEKGLPLHEFRHSKAFAIECQKAIHKDIETKPFWDGTPMPDKTIFVYYEAALGDTLQYVRYLDCLKGMFKKVLFKPQLAFVDFFKENNFGAEIIDGKTLPEDVVFDIHIPLISIPQVLGHFSEEIPLSEGYLKANPEKVQYFKQKYFNNDKHYVMPELELAAEQKTSLFRHLITDNVYEIPHKDGQCGSTQSKSRDDATVKVKNKLKIGFKWMGNTVYDMARVINIESFYKLFELPNTQFYSLQKGEGVEEFAKIPKEYNVIDLSEEFNDFGDTAAAIENLDLVICNDTSVAHLAAAMGKPTWILLPFVPNWRWHTDISYSPWYKSVKFFKQSEPNNWDDVFEQVYEKLSIL